MKVFIFDLLAYGENLDHIKQGTELPYPLSHKHFNADVAARTYAEHLEAWEALDRLGYDGVGFNEHHCSPYGLMNSPNLMASAAAQRTKKLKLLIYGNLLPLHEPLRLAEELAMLDCLSNGRIISGFARGIPREYQVHNVPMSQSRERFEEAILEGRTAALLEQLQSAGLRRVLVSGPNAARAEENARRFGGHLASFDPLAATLAQASVLAPQSDADAERLKQLGIHFMTETEVIGYHLAHVLRRHAEEFLGILCPNCLSDAILQGLFSCVNKPADLPDSGEFA